MIKNFIPEGVADLNYDEYEKMHQIEDDVTRSFRESGYRQILTPTFEYYDLFAEDDLSGGTEDMYKIMDAGGKLMVLRPDATIPIARMVATHYKEGEATVRLMYLTNVYRSADFRAGEKREFKQAGIEIFGSRSAETDADVIESGMRAVRAAGFADLSTELGDTNYFSGLLEELGRRDERFRQREIRNRLRVLVETKDVPGLETFAEESGMPEDLARVLLQLPLLYGDVTQVLDTAMHLAANQEMRDAVSNIRNILDCIGEAGDITVDMGLINRLEYYSGMIFKVYLKNTGVIIGSGGRYDKLMKKFGKDIPAVGFGLDINTLYEAQETGDGNAGVLNIALGKGRLADITVEKLQSIGIRFPDYSKESRKLIFEDESGRYRIIFVKAVDVGIYVEKGACDVGVIGKDTLLESASDVFELLDLGYGRCRFAVAAPKGFRYDPEKKLRVATKYTRVAREYFARMGRSIEMIKINGSVELAPLVGLSDVIVDIVETGTTLRENGLEVVEYITDISARFIVNRASLKTRDRKVRELMESLKQSL